MRKLFAVIVTTSFVACVPPPKSVDLIPVGVKTSIEKTTVVVKDPQGNVMRIEEKEMVLQDYSASEPVQLKSVKSPAVQKLRVENGKIIEAQ